MVSTFLQLFSVKPTKVCSAPAGAAKLFDNTGGTSNKNYDLNSAYEMAYRLPEQRTGSQFHYVAPLTLFPNLCWHLLQEICFFQQQIRGALKKFQNQP